MLTSAWEALHTPFICATRGSRTLVKAHTCNSIKYKQNRGIGVLYLIFNTKNIRDFKVYNWQIFITLGSAQLNKVGLACKAIDLEADLLISLIRS